MRGRSIHARAILRQVSAHRNGAPSIAPPSAVARASPSARGFISTCELRSARPTARRNANFSATASSSSSSKTSSAKSGSSASSAPSSGGNSSSSNAGAFPTTSNVSTNKKTPKTPATSVKGKGLKVAGVTPANPPPSSLRNVAWESFFSNDRPLLQHELLPPKSEQGFAQLHVDGNSGKLTGVVAADGMFGKFPSSSSMQWRRRIASIESERFGKLIEGLAGTQESAATAKPDNRYLEHLFRPESDRVAIESAKLDEEERLREEQEEAVHYALERGEDAEAARKLGAEADLIILGEPEGPDPEWTRGVALHLAENCRAYEPPAPPQVQDGTKVAEHAPSSMSDRIVESVYLTDDDPNLLLSHAVMQSSLPLVLKWDALVAKMDAAALNDPSQATNSVVDLTRLNAKLNKSEVRLDSTRRKRKKKMRKHKYKKLRKLQRPERQKLKK